MVDVIDHRDRVGDAADRHILDVRCLGAEDRHDLVGLTLDFQGLQIMRDGPIIPFVD